MENYNEDAKEIYFSLYQNAKIKEVKAPKKIYKSGKRTYHTTTKGIYFLYIGSVVVYVGKSTSCIEARLYKHKYSKEFNYVRVIELADYGNAIHSAEMFYINMFNPTYNILDKEYTYDYLLNDTYKEKREKVTKYIYEYDYEFKKILDAREEKQN